ncbi:gliding motility-associated ABC transporter ATP-binding subunit GldA [Flammeovirgaceae bacterium SG7u.111]|nr:gliding motility-associated ABC transporter ATP-binding subunit GldA [Flammeovirgaceae bacterium SG7u.132]WPO35433.1 gliding motility-associated ABC transporter ATP-binding subunit GldA [Flammeovirgaceae bacterium SG7u.111]
MSVKISNLSKIYGEQKAVNNISFEAKEGEILGFLGPNGAGKSTTMKIATCYLSPSMGKVEVCGHDVEKSPLEVRKIVGYLPEHNPLYLDMYVKEYLGYVAGLNKIKGAKRKGRIAEMVELVGLQREQHKKIGALSKGYRQRIGLAQALIHDPKVLILDEPTTGLDPNQILEIRQVIKNISKEKTVIFSTHIMQEVQALCDRVIIINLGQIVADSSVELLKQQAGDIKILLEFDEAIDLAVLGALEGVKQLNELGNCQYEVIADGEEDIRSELFKLAVRENWVLKGMAKEELSLERIFHQLTKAPAVT